MTLSAAPPAWWSLPDATNHPVIDPAITDGNPKGPANIGQAKYMAKRALDILNTVDPSLATQIHDKLTRCQPKPSSPDEQLPPIADLDVPSDPLAAGWLESQHAPLLIGQLKAMAAPFYDILYLSAPLWLDNESPDPAQQGQLQLNATKDHSDPSNYYPWTADPGDDRNHAIATIGQLKAVFSLRVETLNAILDNDHDGLTNAQEALYHTDPGNPDTDGDGMPDAWEIKWGLNPLNPADAADDPDVDCLSNLAEYQAGTCPTGQYRIEVLPTGSNTFFHSAADDGSVIMQATMLWDATSALEKITAPDTTGTRTIVPVPPDNWHPLDAILNDLMADHLIDETDNLTPTGLESSDGTYQVYETHTDLLILHEPGYPISWLPAEIPWQAINNNGQALAITERMVPAADSVPEHMEADLSIDYGYYTNTVRMPDVWFPAAEMPSLLAFSDHGDVLLLRSLTNPDGTTNSETYLLKTFERSFTQVRQPGLPGEAIVAISPTNTRMLGSGPSTFQITPDGTPILLANLQITTSPAQPTAALATLYPSPLFPLHITSDGRITLTTTDSNHQPTLLQIIPDNDANHNGLMDDWERRFADMLLASGKSAADWGPLYAGLLAGNLNPATDYTSEGITAGDLAELFQHPPSQQSPDGLEIESQARRNILAWGLHVPASGTARERNEGVYYYENDGYYGAGIGITSLSQLQPDYMETTILSNPWESNTICLGWSRFYTQEYSGECPFTEYDGDFIQSRIRLVADSTTSRDRSRSYLRTTTRVWYPETYNNHADVMYIENQDPTIPAGKLFSEWIELIPPIADGYEYTVSLDPFNLGVDANRDGKIAFDGTDSTSEKKPFVFWVNDDHDVKDYTDLDGITKTIGQYDVFDDVPDSADNQIACVRDLEDFARLHIAAGSLADDLMIGTLTLGIKFVESSGSPSIKIYLSAEHDGGMQYLLDNTAGEAQLADAKHSMALGKVDSNIEFKFPSDIWNKNLYLIFEGASEGKGKLQLTIYDGEQKLASCGNLWIELKNIKQMYQRWNANEVDKPGVQWNVWPSQSATQDTDSAAPPTPRTDDEKDFVLFVHGWNMSKQEKRGFAETAYKRMWQIGYKGRFGAFFWPTFYDKMVSTGHFDGSEQRAWNSSSALLELLNTLNQTYPGRINVMAHSMGNIAASEAFHKATKIVAKNYVASQAALAADVFKLNEDITSLWSTVLTQTMIGYSISLPVLKDVVTPNVYAYYYEKGRTDLNYRKQQFPKIGMQYMTGIGGAANWCNYLNPADWALGLWICDQAKKPNGVTPLQAGYEYHSILLDSTWGFKKFDDHIEGGFCYLYIPDDTYEIFSYCAQARCRPTGRQNMVGGPFKSQRNFSEYGDRHPGHSAQFLESICTRWHYWDRLLTDCKLAHIKYLKEE